MLKLNHTDHPSFSASIYVSRNPPLFFLYKPLDPQDCLGIITPATEQFCHQFISSR